MRSDLERLRDIDEAIAKIEKYAVQGNVAFRICQTLSGILLKMADTVCQISKKYFMSRYQLYLPDV